MSTTIVTCYFPLGKKSKHSENLYKTWIANFVIAVDGPLVIYTNEPGRETLGHYFENRSQLLIETQSIDDFFVSKIVSESAWHDQWRMDDEKSMHSVELYKIWNEKSNFLYKTAERNPFSTSHFVWTDIGSFRDENRAKNHFHPWPTPTAAFDKTDKEDKIFILRLGSFSGNEIAALLQEKQKTKTIAHGPRFESLAVRVGGGIFGGSRAAVQRWHSLYYDLLEKRIAKHLFAGKDQLLMATISFAVPDLVKMIDVPAGYAFDRWFYLQDYLKR